MLKTTSKDIFMGCIASGIEGFDGLPYRGGNVSKDYIKYLQRKFGLGKCPRNKQPNPDPPDSRRSISCSDEVYEHVLVFTAQEFGRLGYTLPANMSHELPKYLTLLISLCKDLEDRRMRGEDIGISKSDLNRRIQILHKKYSSLFPDQHS
jgi:hypothetical protein